MATNLPYPFPIEKEYKAVKSMYLNNTILNLLATLGSGLAGFGLDSLQEFVNASKDIKTIQDFYVFLAIFGFIGIAVFGRLTIKSLSLYLKYRDISKDIQQIGDALLISLIKAGAIKTDYSKLKVKTSINN